MPEKKAGSDITFHDTQVIAPQKCHARSIGKDGMRQRPY